MKTLTIHLQNSDQEMAVRQFLDGLRISYEATNEMDETDYITSSPVMVQRLNEAKVQKERGEGIKITLDDIWK